MTRSRAFSCLGVQALAIAFSAWATYSALLTLFWDEPPRLGLRWPGWLPQIVGGDIGLATASWLAILGCALLCAAATLRLLVATRGCRRKASVSGVRLVQALAACGVLVFYGLYVSTFFGIGTFPD